MSYDEIFDFLPERAERPPDPVEERARAELVSFFDGNRDRVFFSRQLEVRYEKDYFHWVTNRALRDLRESGLVRSEKRTLRSGGEITLVWHRSFRYYRRAANSVIELVEEYADPNIGGALGLHGEAMVLEGFAREQFVMKGRAVREYDGKAWVESEHNLDFIFARDGRSYGIEVKNTLGYLNDGEFKLKIRLAKELGLIPVFVVRMIPRTWVSELVKEGGFALILKYQLYPWTHRHLARRVQSELGLPVDAPRALESGTMDRFTRWHESKL
jgi:hypothetical protein